MENKKFKPLVDKLFHIIWIPTSCLLLIATYFSAFEPLALFITLAVDVLCFYFIISPLFGYVELRDNSIFIKVGFFIKKEIPYDKIRGITKERKIYSESMISLKNAMEHVNIKYNRFDVISVSVNTNDEFIGTLEERCAKYVV